MRVHVESEQFTQAIIELYDHLAKNTEVDPSEEPRLMGLIMRNGGPKALLRSDTEQTSAADFTGGPGDCRIILKPNRFLCQLLVALKPS